MWRDSVKLCFELRASDTWCSTAHGRRPLGGNYSALSKGVAGCCSHRFVVGQEGRLSAPEIGRQLTGRTSGRPFKRAHMHANTSGTTWQIWCVRLFGIKSPVSFGRTRHRVYAAIWGSTPRTSFTIIVFACCQTMRPDLQ